jgi:transcriptional regulator with XRE-family HTH domain
MSRPNREILRLPYNQKTMTDLGKLAAQRIRDAREGAGLTQAELADALGITRAAVTSIENGRSTLTLRNLEELPRILHKPLTFFLGLDSGLTADEAELLELYRALPPGFPRESARGILRTLLETIRRNRGSEAPDTPQPGEPGGPE